MNNNVITLMIILENSRELNATPSSRKMSFLSFLLLVT